MHDTSPPSSRAPSVVVTGASSGIGWATVQALCDHGFHVFASVQSPDSAETLKANFGAAVTPLVFDVRDEAAVAEAAERVRTALGGATLAGLVNNAGIAVYGPMRYLTAADFQDQFDVNLFGVVKVTKAFLPMLGADPAFQGQPGRIVMISSVAGKVATPFLSPYCASKHALEGLSTSLRRELLPHGIDVIVVGPGVIATPIWDKADQADLSRFADTEYGDTLKRMRRGFTDLGREGVPPSKVGQAIVHILTAGHPKTRYAVAGGIHWLARLIPARMADRLMAKRLGLQIKRS